MAIAALLSLLYKRSREDPKRHILIWFLDTSKQAIAASLVHFTNVFLSLITSKLTGSEDLTNPCAWYFLNLLIDCTVGVYILYLGLRMSNYIAKRFFRMTDIESGVYGSPPRFLPWFKQLLIFLHAWVWVKVVVVIALVYLPFLSVFAEWVLAPFASEQLQIIFVMFIFPLVMNVIQALLIDRIIKGSTPHLRLEELVSQEAIPNAFESNSSIADEERGLLEDEGSVSPPDQTENISVAIPSNSSRDDNMPLFSSQNSSVFLKVARLFRSDKANLNASPSSSVRSPGID